MHRTTTLALLLTSVLATGCDAGSPEPGGDVVGTWRQAPNPFDEPPEPADELRTWTFLDDGTVSWSTPAWEEDTGAGTYETADGRLIVTADDDDRSFDLSYYADDAAFLLGVVEPDDDGDDAVATWTGYGVYGEVRVASTVTMRDDGTARFVQTVRDETTTRDGTWSQREDAVQLMFVETVGESTITTRMSAHMYGGFLGELHEPR